MLLEADGYDVVGEAPDGRSAIVAARALDPDVILLDIQLPDIDGFEVSARLSAHGDPPAVVGVTRVSLIPLGQNASLDAWRDLFGDPLFGDAAR